MRKDCSFVCDTVRYVSAATTPKFLPPRANHLKAFSADGISFDHMRRKQNATQTSPVLEQKDHQSVRSEIR